MAIVYHSKNKGRNTDMKKYEQYLKILENIKTMADMQPLNIVGCEICFDVIQKQILEAKKIKAGLQ